MKFIAVLLCAWLLPACHVRADETVPRPEPALLDVETSLRAALKDINPPPVFEYSKDARTFFVKCQTRKYLVYSRYMTGEYGDKAYEEEGPCDKGILLAVFAEDPGVIRQADLLRDYVMRRPYWNEEFDTTASVGTGKVLQWKISYGDNVKAKFLKDMKETIRTMDRKRLAEAGAVDKKRPVLKITSGKTAYFGSLMLYTGDRNAVLIVGWQIPENVSKPFSQSIEVGKQSLSVELLRGPDVSRYLSPGGAPPPPFPAEPGYSREKAVSGTLHCTPKGKSPDGRSIVTISMENLCFPGTIVELTGPIEARLGLPPPP